MKEPDLARISILTATSFEFLAVGRALSNPRRVQQYGNPCLLSTQCSNTILLVSTGIGPQKAEMIATRLLQTERWDLIVSTGFAGALKDYPIGTVVLGSEVVCDSAGNRNPSPVICDPVWLENVSRISLGKGSLPVGRFVSASHVLTGSKEKQELASRTGGVAVDMESLAIGRMASHYQVPFLIIRSISDGSREDLPLDFNLFLSKGGWVTGILTLLSSIEPWKGLFRLYRQSRHASRQLTRFLRLFFSSLVPTVSGPTASVVVS